LAVHYIRQQLFARSFRKDKANALFGSAFLNVIAFQPGFAAHAFNGVGLLEPARPFAKDPFEAAVAVKIPEQVIATAPVDDANLISGAWNANCVVAAALVSGSEAFREG
jgi:hypothetical protein